MQGEFAVMGRLSLGEARRTREAESQRAAGAAVVVSLLVKREKKDLNVAL